LIESAQKNSVEDTYIKKAAVFQQQMSDNIQAREILQMFLDYPVREYPVEEVVDPKKKKAVKKEEEKKKKKRKKKEPPFPIPEWATELESVQNKVARMNELLTNAADIYLDEDFLEKTNE